jgi:hypothetical protein
VTPDATATLVWLASEPPGGAERGALAAWAIAHGVILSPPLDASPPTLDVDPRVADEVETRLEHARDSLTARDGPGVDREVDAADALLRAHPELPQAAWLMAEVERARATRFAQSDPPDTAAVAVAWARAEALDGGRLGGIGEPSPPHRSDAAGVSVSLPWGAALQIDGHPAPPHFTALVGLHAVVVTRGDLPAWARWVEFGIGDSSIRPALPAPEPCSAPDVSRASLEADGRAVSASQVSCPHWVVVAPGSRAGSLRIASCAAARCDEPVVWPAEVAWPRAVERAPASSPPSKWPSWATWAIVGAGVAIAAGAAATAAATGAFASGASETRFVTGGLVHAP